jgi:hypothetical protein
MANVANSRARVIILSLAWLASPASAWGEKAYLYHWNKPEFVAHKLRVGGFDFAGQSHTNDLGQPGRHAWDLGAVVRDARERYFQQRGSRGFNLGAGLYARRDLLDGLESSHGTDLMVIELDTAGHDPLAHAAAPKAYELETAKVVPQMRASLDERLPLLSHDAMRNQGKDYILYRAPKPDERVGVTMRPPTAEDVPRIWREQSQTEHGALEFLRRLAKVGKVPTAPARIVIDRLLYDEGHRYLVDKLAATPSSFARRDPFLALTDVLGAFEKLPVGTEKTRQLGQRWCALLSPSLLHELSRDELVRIERRVADPRFVAHVGPADASRAQGMIAEALRAR